MTYSRYFGIEISFKLYNRQFLRSPSPFSYDKYKKKNQKLIYTECKNVKNPLKFS